MKLPHRLIGILLVFVMLVACLPLMETEVSAVSADGYLTVNEATQKMKQHMLNRNTDTLELKVYVEDSRPLGDMQIRELFDESIYKHTGVPAEGDFLRYESTGNSYYVTEHSREGNKHWLTIFFTANYFQSSARNNTLNNKVKEIISSLNLNGKSDYEKALAIYSYVCKNVNYDLAYEQVPAGTQDYNDLYSAYGALVNNKAVCQGFALAMYRLLLEAGIENQLIADNNHIWNAVKLGESILCIGFHMGLRYCAGEF